MLLDVSMPVAPGTAEWPGDTPFSCGWSASIAGGAPVNVSWVKTSPHVGTHVDAPYHYDAHGARLGDLPLEAFIGPCRVIDAVGASEIDARLLRGIDLRATPRILFRTTARNDPTTFRRDFPLLTLDAVDALAAAGVRLVGMDAPSFDDTDSKDLPIHHALGRAGIANVENLVLDTAQAGAYELFAAPVLWRDGDAAPLRAILRRR